MYASLLNVLHHTANQGLACVIADAINIALNGVIQKAVKQHRRVMADLDGLAHVAFQIALLMHDFHGPTPQHIAGSNHQGVTQGSGFFQGLGFGASRGIGRLTQAKRMQKFLESFTVFSRVNHVGRSANNGHTIGL